MLGRGIVFIHDNSRPHIANVTKQLLGILHGNVLSARTWYLVIFIFVLHKKSLLGGQNFNVDDEVKEAVNTWLQSQAALNDKVIQKLVPCYDKCLNNGGN